MLPPLTRRLLFTGLPTLIIAAVVVSTIWGDHGLVRRWELQAELERNNDVLASVERENQRLLRDLTLMQRDPVVLERMVAEELGWGADDAILFRFDEQ